MTCPPDEDLTDGAGIRARPASHHERWFDLGFRLIILLLAAIWLMMPPAAGDVPPLALTTAKETR